MTARSIRRAAERKARKAAEKQSRLEQPSVETQPTVSEAKLAANRGNAQLSTGPRTTARKAVSSMNAVKTGLTGRTVLLRWDAKKWDREIVEQGEVSAAGCAVAELSGEGRKDIVCIGQATHNLVIYRLAGSR